MSFEVVIESEVGLVEAPAGCGKTHLIVEAISKSQPSKPILVLTHTTAGVTSLRQKLKSENVTHSSFRVATIDGWALRVAHMFPVSCQLHSILKTATQVIYPELRKNVAGYIEGENLTEIIQATYSRIFVDEYQDCNLFQHRLISALARMIPTIVFGDPMQTIFNFENGASHPDWENDVLSVFPMIHELNDPWRWKKHNKGLGDWILAAREQLKNKEKLDLAQAHQHVSWHRLEGNQAQMEESQTNEFAQLLNKKNKEERIFVIGNSLDKNERYSVAKKSYGLDVVEPVELGDVGKSIDNLDNTLLFGDGEALAIAYFRLLKNLVDDINPNRLLENAKHARSGVNGDDISAWEKCMMNVLETKSVASLYELTVFIDKNQPSKIFRKSAFGFLKELLKQASNSEISLKDAFSSAKERRRQDGDKRIPRNCIGSTLLLKGLEAEYVMLLNANKLASKHLANHLYVAISRGIKHVSIFSENPIVG